MLNTIKTTLRFFGSVIRKYTPMKSKDNSIEEVLNYLNYSNTLSSSGQPRKNQFSLIQEKGYTIVINLAPYELIENPLKDEEAIVIQLGMRYIHIPVNFFNPTKKDFDTFVKAMKSASGEKIWVHCAANARASAFSYKYRCSALGVDEQTAIWDLREIWEPFGVWKKFLFDDYPPPPAKDVSKR